MEEEYSTSIHAEDPTSSDNMTTDERRLIPKDTIHRKLQELEMTEQEYQIFLQYKIMKKLEEVVELIKTSNERRLI